MSGMNQIRMALAGERKEQTKRRSILAFMACIVILFTAVILMLPAISASKSDLENAGVAGLSNAVTSEETADEDATDGDDASDSQEEASPSDPADSAESDATSTTDSASSTSDDNQASESSDNGDNSDSADQPESTPAGDGEEAVADPDATDENAGEQAAEEDAETPMPAQNFYENLKKKDKDGNEYIDLAVYVEAPEGAFPEGTTMKIKRVKDKDIKDEVEQAVKDAKGDNSTVKRMTAVDIVFLNADGDEIEPAKKVDVKISANDVREIEEPVLVHVVDKDKATQAKKKTDAEVLKKVDVVNWDDEDKSKGNEDTLKFATREFSPYVIVEVETITADVITASGEAYKITVSYDEKAGIPEGAELRVKEVVEGDEVYADYLQQAKEAAVAKGLVNEQTLDQSYARFFDIEIWVKDEKVEPAKDVSVNISLADAPKKDEADFAVVHFDTDGPQVVDLLHAANDDLKFQAESFSVYGVIATPGSTGVNDLDGRSFTMSRDGSRYVTANAVGSNPAQLGKSSNSSDAATWTMEAAGSDGQYNIFTYVGNDKKYLNLSRNSDTDANVTLGDNPQPFTVIDNGDGTYRLRATSGNYNYYLNEWGGSGGNSFAGYRGNNGQGNINDERLTFKWDQPILETGNQYAVVVKYEGSYYSVDSDGSLSPVAVDDMDNPKTVTLGAAMLWTYDTDGSIYHHTDMTDVNVGQTACDFYYKYIDINNGLAIHEEQKIDISNNDAGGYQIGADGPSNDDVQLWVQSATHPNAGPRNAWFVKEHKQKSNMVTNYDATTHELKNKDNSRVLTVAVVDGVLRLVTQPVSAGPGVEVFFTDVSTSVPAVSPYNHTVDHIDISIQGSANVQVPLAYGMYYKKNDDGSFEEYLKIVEGNYYVKQGGDWVVATDDQGNPLTNSNPITVHKDLDITGEDIKSATLIATDKNGKTVEDAFYISGYSGNAPSGNDPWQIRIEGSFKVADCDPVPTTGSPNTDAIKADRMNNVVYYSVSTTKHNEPLTVSYNNVVLYNEHYEQMDLTADITISSKTFNYWSGNGSGQKDDGNTCPALTIYGYHWQDNLLGHDAYWKWGGIYTGPDPHNSALYMSGIDYRLGGSEVTARAEIPGMEVTKYIMDDEGNTIALDPDYYSDPAHKIQTVVKVFEKEKSADDYDSADVLGLNGGDATRKTQQIHADGEYPEPTTIAGKENLYDGYEEHETYDLTLDVNDNGEGFAHNYNVTDGMYYITEDPNSVAKEVIGADGTRYRYLQTHIESEYAWRNDEYTAKDYGGEYNEPVHVSPNYSDLKNDTYRSIPEVLGNYKDKDGSYVQDNGAPVRNTMLPFYIYNIYIPDVKLDVEKKWSNTDAPEGAEVTVDLYYAKRMVKDADGNKVDPVADWPEKSEYRPVTEELLFNEINAPDMVKQLTLKADSDEAKNWKGSFTGLPQRLPDVDGSIWEFDYFAKETAAKIGDRDITAEYEVVEHKTEPKDADAHTSDGTVTIINGKGSLNFEKKWYRTDGTTEYTPTSSDAVVTAELWRSGTVVTPGEDTTVTEDPVTVTVMARASNNDSYRQMFQVTDLGPGKSLSFSIGNNETSWFDKDLATTEPGSAKANLTSVDGQTVTYTGGNAGTKNGNANVYTLSNVTENTTIYATLTRGGTNNLGYWFDDSYERPGTHVVPGQSTSQDVDEKVSDITLDQSNGWKFRLSAAEMEPGWTYYIKQDTVQETGISSDQFDFNSALTTESDQAGNTTVYCSNTSKGVNLDVEKKWDPTSPAPEGAEITADLQYQLRAANTSDNWSEPALVKDQMEEGGLFYNTGINPTVVLKADEDASKSWKGRYEGLPTTIVSGDTTYDVQYTATETAVMVDGKDVTKQYHVDVQLGTPTASGDNCVVITNKKETVVIEVEKKWTQTPDPSTNASVTVELHRYAKKTKGTLTCTLTDQHDAPVAGANFTLQKLNEETNQYDNTETTAVSDQNGIVTATNLDAGTYRWVQTSTPTGYDFPEGVTDSQATDSFKVEEDETAKQEASYELKNTIQKSVGVVTLNVTDNNGAPIAGATFTLFNENGTPVEGKEGLLTTAEGKIIVSDLDPGTYYFQQTATPDAYKMPANTETERFTVDGNKPGVMQEFDCSMANTLKGKGTIEVALTRAADSTPIAGATFEVKLGSEIVATLVTGEDGKATTAKLDAGVYTVTQTATGADLMLAEPQNVKIEDNGDANQEKSLTFTNEYQSLGTATVTLKKKEDNQPISGVTFQLLNGDGEVVATDTTDANGQVVFGSPNKLGAGTYTVKQTSQLEGYTKASDQTFTIEDNKNPNQTATINLTNEEDSGKVTIELWRTQGNVEGNGSNTGGKSLHDTLQKQKPGSTIRVNVTRVQSGHEMFYCTNYNSENSSGDWVRIRDTDWSGNDAYFDFTIPASPAEATYKLAVSSSWGLNSGTVSFADTSSANSASKAAVKAPAKANALKAAKSTATTEETPAQAKAPAKAASVTTAATPSAAPEGYAEDKHFEVQTVTIGAGDSWKKAFPAQDKYDADGNEYKYYVVETACTPDTYWASKYEGDLLSDNGTITVTNEQKLGALKITKDVTVNGDTVPETDKTIADGTYTFKIEGPNRYSEERTITVSQGVATGDITLEDLTAGRYTVTEIRSTNTNGIQLVADPVVHDVVAGSTASDAMEFAFTNNLETTQVTVNKVWNDEAEHDAIHYSVCRIPVAGTTEYDPQTVTTGTLSADNGWTETIANLPKAGKLVPTEGADAVDVTYRYYVSEENVHGYSSEVTEGASDANGQNFTITNTPYGHFSDQTDLAINKEWKNADGTDAPADEHDNDSITFQVTQKKHEAKTADGTAIYPVRINLVNADGTTSDLSEMIYMPQDVRLNLTPQSSATGTHRVHVTGVDGNRSNTNVLPYTSLYISNANGGRVITLTLLDTGETWGTSTSANTWTLAKSATVATNIISKSDLLDRVNQTGSASGASSYVMELTDDKTGTVVGKYGTAIGNPAGSEGTKWAGSVNDLPFFEEEDGVFYVYTYEVTEVKIDEVAVGPTNEAGFNGETSRYFVKWEGNNGSWTITNQKKPAIDLTIRKIAKANVAGASATTEVLPGATFTLYKYTSAEYQQKDPEWTPVEIKDADNTTPGVFSFTNLPIGYYQITEDVAPAGYVKTTEAPRFQVKKDGNDLVIVLLDQNGQPISSGTTEMLKVDNASQAQTIYFGNEPGKPLPNTGGMGTVVTTLLGMLMVAAAGAVFLAGRRPQLAQAAARVRAIGRKGGRK